MVGVGSALIGLGLWFAFVWWRRRDIPKTKWFLRAVARLGGGDVLTIEAGWIVTEVGRQPWIVYEVMRAEDAVTGASGIWVTFGIARRALHGARGRGDPDPALDGAALARRGGGWTRTFPTRPAKARPPRRREVEVSTADAVAGVLWVGVTLYAVFGGADFGAGFWSLVAGSGERGKRARALIDWAIGPVWEANHVWLIFVLVVLWTAFSAAFAAIFSTLFIPLSLAALGIVLRGAGFAFHGSRPAPGAQALARRCSASPRC